MSYTIKYNLKFNEGKEFEVFLKDKHFAKKVIIDSTFTINGEISVSELDEDNIEDYGIEGAVEREVLWDHTILSDLIIGKVSELLREDGIKSRIYITTPMEEVEGMFEIGGIRKWLEQN